MERIMQNIEATQVLLKYKDKLKQEILDLRAQACDKASIVRSIEKCISSQDEQDLIDFLTIQESYSIKGLDKLIFNK